MLATVLWLSLGLVLFSYAAYPLVLTAWCALADLRGALRFLSGGPERRERGAPVEWPRVTLLFAAHDEESCIEQKIASSLALDYPPELLEIVVGCDGCTDGTAELARRAGDGRVRVVELSPRAGKASVLARLVPAASGDIVVLTDANVVLERGAVRALARRFRHPDVGAVVGRLRLRAGARGAPRESLYWKYETYLKYLEGKLGAVVGANGGIYAIRRILFGPLPVDTITDDFVIPARIALRGWRVPFEPTAVVWEDASDDVRREFGRRARIGAGNWQALWRLPELVSPRRGFLAFSFVCHKLLRWLTPFLLAAACAATVRLAADPGAWTYRLLLVAEVAGGALAAVGARGLGGRLAAFAAYFVAMNAALAVGLWRFLRGSRAPRGTGPSGPRRCDRRTPRPVLPVGCAHALFLPGCPAWPCTYGHRTSRLEGAARRRVGGTGSAGEERVTIMDRIRRITRAQHDALRALDREEQNAVELENLEADHLAAEEAYLRRKDHLLGREVPASYAEIDEARALLAGAVRRRQERYEALRVAVLAGRSPDPGGPMQLALLGE